MLPLCLHGPVTLWHRLRHNKKMKNHRRPFLLAGLLLVAVTLGCTGANGSKSHSEPVSLYTDFSSFKTEKLKLPAKQEFLSLVAVGDIMLSRGVAMQIQENKDPGQPFDHMEEYLQRGDITFGNLEGPITEGRKIEIPEMIFRADPGVENALKNAGFDILSLANNHTMDFGARGLIDTMTLLNKAGIKHTGAGKKRMQAYTPVFLEVKGIKTAFLAFNDPSVLPGSHRLAGNGPGTAILDRALAVKAIKEAGERADFVIVSMHAGTEYIEEPDRLQYRFAHLFIDAGADLIVGHHSHVVQRVEKYKGKYIIYSLGNFVFDQMWSRDTREGLIAKIYISHNKPVQVEYIEFIPIYINDRTQPELLKGDRARAVIKKLKLPVEEIEVPVWDEDAGSFFYSIRYLSGSFESPGKYRLNKKRFLDLDRDNTGEIYSLQGGRLTVKINTRTIWKSPSTWWVEDFFLGDSNNDGILNLNLLIWKEGNFGPSKPFWVPGKDNTVKCHLFIFKLEEGIFKPVWQSSNLDRPAYRGIIEDINEDGENELMVVESSYTDNDLIKPYLLKWNGWGFSLIDLQEVSKPL